MSIDCVFVREHWKLSTYWVTTWRGLYLHVKKKEKKKVLLAFMSSDERELGNIDFV